MPDAILIAAPPADAPAILALTERSGILAVLDRYDGCPLLFDPLESAFETLFSLLEVDQDADEDDCVLASAGEDGPWVLRARQDLAQALTHLENADPAALAARWQQSHLPRAPDFERSTWKRSDFRAELSGLLEDLAKVQRQLVGGGKALFVVTEM